MLVCPQCQFHNADVNKFCQQCGTSLIAKTCAGCDCSVPFECTHCPACGYATGTLWWALLYPKATPASTCPPEPAVTTDRADVADIAELTAPTTTPDAPAPHAFDPPTAADLQTDTVGLAEDPAVMMARPNESELEPLEPTLPDLSVLATVPLGTAELTADDPSLPEPQYLDQAQRYQLLTPAPVGATAVQVLDCQPFQLSPLNVIQQQLQGMTPPLELSQPQVVTNYLADQQPQLPDIAHPYLALQVQFPQNLPTLHDAWVTEHHIVLLLEEQSQLPELTECWQDEHLPPLQVLYWLRQSLNLWQALLPWGCAHSLLMLPNLRFNPDLRLRLRQLLWAADVPDLPTEPELADLLQTWNQLFSLCPPDRLTAFEPLLSQLDPDLSQNLGDIQSILHSLTMKLQPPESLTGTDKPAPTGLSPITQVDDTAGGNVPTILLPNQLVKLEAVGRTDVGRDRHHNEDFFVIHNQTVQVASPEGQQVQAQGIFILCDGMGGHAQGEVASSMAANTLIHYFQTHWPKYEMPGDDSIATAIYQANQTLFQGNEARASAGSDRMGTTLVMVLIQDTLVRVAHVGDSRLYRFTRSRGLEQITLDHEVGQREISRGVSAEIAYARPDAYQLTQALGPRGDNSIRPDIQSFTVEEDAVLLLASDGLTDNELVETYKATHIQPLLHARTDLEQAIDQLIDLANEHNGHDNITAIAIRMKVRPQLAPTLQTE